jgi:hypothetical protein
MDMKDSEYKKPLPLFPSLCSTEETISPSRPAFPAATRSSVQEGSAFGRASHFRFRPPLQSTGSGSGKPIKYCARHPTKQRDHAHLSVRRAIEAAEAHVSMNRLVSLRLAMPPIGPTTTPLVMRLNPTHAHAAKPRKQRQLSNA